MALAKFGEIDGRRVEEVTLSSGQGSKAKIITWGAALRDLSIASRGSPRSLVLGLNTLEHYVQHSPHFGAIAGRFAGRIGGGTFALDGARYELPRNENGVTSLHGGGSGFGKRVWTLQAHDAASATLSLHSPDGDAGYPGAVDVTCTYRLSATALRIELSATSDRPTPINLCNHAYFNLDGSDTILDHEVEIAADLFTPVDRLSVPTGEIRSVVGTPCDFRVPRPVRLIENGERQRYDDNWVLRRATLDHSAAGPALALAARARSTVTGQGLEVWTTQPGLQFYDGYKLDLPVAGLGGTRYGPCAGMCFEAQHFPDSPNQPHFPSTILRPGETYRQVTEYRFPQPR